jgi:hypothetical protein
MGRQPATVAACPGYTTQAGVSALNFTEVTFASGSGAWVFTFQHNARETMQG